MDVVDQAAELLGYRFDNAELLNEALTHASSAGHRLQSNERMEFFGDAILGVVVCEYLYHTYPDLLEGELTKIKSAVVSRKICARVSTRLQLSDMLNLGKGMSNRPTVPSSVSAAAFESIIAAMYLDGGIEPTSNFILEHLRPIIDEAAESTHQSNFKSLLQQYTQKHMPCNPNYVVLDEKGPDHAKCFEVCVEVSGRRFSSAWAQSKKEAEQRAALLAMKELLVASVDEHGRIELSDFSAPPDPAIMEKGKDLAALRSRRHGDSGDDAYDNMADFAAGDV